MKWGIVPHQRTRFCQMVIAANPMDPCIDVAIAALKEALANWLVLFQGA